MRNNNEFLFGTQPECSVDFFCVNTIGSCEKRRPVLSICIYEKGDLFLSARDFIGNPDLHDTLNWKNA